MPSFNRIQLIGHLGKDPRYNTTKSGTEAVDFSLATKFKDSTDWHNCKAYGKTAQWLQEGNVLKGTLLFVEGRMSYGSYEKDGVTIRTADVMVDRFLILGGQRAKKDVASESEQNQDDLPF